jgi:hypothetical protein
MTSSSLRTKFIDAANCYSDKTKRRFFQAVRTTEGIVYTRLALLFFLYLERRSTTIFYRPNTSPLSEETSGSSRQK